jgi:hypothetical protein
MRCPLALALVAALVAVAALVLIASPGAWAAGDRPADEIRPRVEHHLAEAEQIARQLEAVMAEGCPTLASREAWDAYLDGHVDRVVTLVAHLEQAWVEAKQTGDKDVRREAKAPRRRVDRAQQLVQKLQACANGHGASLSPGAVWERIEREVPQRQHEIALPR